MSTIDRDSADRFVQAVAEVGSECYRRCAELEAALVELVAVKDLKERAEAVERNNIHSVHGGEWLEEVNRLRSEYHRRQPLAWAAARAAIAKAGGAQ